ncbi:MAG: cytochrome c oxidase assembly protein [Candidatus Palauibacterales bacterium]|nr:cytochrome c oxidase assembly protein [Candidatus Palauibacterales bacterium]
MQWWCSAQSGYWSWAWQPYVGVWLLVGGLALAYWLLWRGSEPGERDGGEPGSFALGLLLLWAALDWPLAALGATYLATAHMVQYTLISMAAAPLMLRGLPDGTLRRALDAGTAGRILEAATRPMVAFVLFNVVLVGTHWPVVLDTLMATQVGSFALDALSLVAGALFWWPIVSPVPERPGFREVWKLAYLFLNTIPGTIVGLMLVYAEYPAYATYELAPPVFGVSALADQQVAGLVMKFGGGLVLWSVMGVIFFRWYLRESEEAGPAVPADAGAGS